MLRGEWSENEEGASELRGSRCEWPGEVAVRSDQGPNASASHRGRRWLDQDPPGTSRWALGPLSSLSITITYSWLNLGELGVFGMAFGKFYRVEYLEKSPFEFLGDRMNCYHMLNTMYCRIRCEEQKYRASKSLAVTNLDVI